MRCVMTHVTVNEIICHTVTMQLFLAQFARSITEQKNRNLIEASRRVIFRMDLPGIVRIMTV